MKASVTSSVRRSIFKTMAVTGRKSKPVSFAPSSDPHTLIESTMARPSGRKTIRDFVLVDSMSSTIDWRKCAALKVKVFKNVKIQSLATVKSPISFGILKSSSGMRTRNTDRTKNTNMFMQCAPNPFAKGETRFAFHGQLARKKEDLDDNKNSMVMKVFKLVGKGMNDRVQYLKQMEVSNIAHFLAKEYNNSTSRPFHCAQIHYLPVCVVEEETKTNEKIEDRRFCVEPPLPIDSSTTTFQKYSNNTGYWNEDIIDESLLRFTKWTHEITDGYLMVVDL